MAHSDPGSHAAAPKPDSAQAFERSEKSSGGKMDGLARLVWRRVSCPAPEPVFGIAAPQGHETPAGAGCWVLKRSCLPGGSESARCPALRSAGLFGSETGSPRTRVAFLRHGYLVAGVVEGPNPACGPHAKKSPAAAAAKSPRRGRPGIKKVAFS